MARQKRDRWVEVASIDDIAAKHPDWTEDQVREEFDKIVRDWLEKKLAPATPLTPPGPVSNADETKE